jgi:predicted nuclease of restriction endonuclease-like (RecB) superfamily
MNFKTLVTNISTTHERLFQQTTKSINVALTVRNWFFGMFICEFQLKGRDRADYGDRVFDRLSEHLSARGLHRVDARELRRYRQFYLVYPQIREALSPPLLGLGSFPPVPKIRETLSPKFVRNPGPRLLEGLSFSHLDELVQIEDPTKRLFYEVECLKGNWSVRELKRQIGSLYFERSGLSKDKKKLSQLAHRKADNYSSDQVIRDPYVFEFLGLKPKEVFSESHLEDSLLDRIQDFLLELGKGFCFEARQKRIVIGGEHYFVDLVFYHRILKCHILLELKADHFKHEHLGQLNTYVNWFKKNEMNRGDNPPLGILLCTEKNHALAQYALAGMANRLFVSKYQLQLPKRQEIESFIEKQIFDLGDPHSKRIEAKKSVE